MKGLDYASMQFWLDVAQIIVMLAVAVYTYLSNRSKANKDATEKLSERISEVNCRVSTLETKVAHLPDDDDISEIHEKINEVGKNTSQMSGELIAINRTLSLINEHLINNGHRP